MNTTHTSIINSIFTNGHYLTIFELDFYDTTNHPRYIFQDAVYTHSAVLGPDGRLMYNPSYMPIYTSRAYEQYEDALPEYQEFYDMYQKRTPYPTTNLKSKADFGTEVSETYFDEIAKEVIKVDNNIKFKEPDTYNPANIEINFDICGHKFEACVYIDISRFNYFIGNILSNIFDIESKNSITGHGKFYVSYDDECGCSIGSDKSIYTGAKDVNQNSLNFLDDQGIPTDTVLRFIHHKALDVFTKYFIEKENKKNG